MSTTMAPQIAERSADSTRIDVTDVIPCLNEAEPIASCVGAARKALAAGHYDGEVVVVDNGSTEGSGDQAQAAGPRVGDEPKRSRGTGYHTGLTEARRPYSLML